MKIELISIGDEILSGDILNTNIQFLSQGFWDLGYAVCHHTAIRDNTSDIEQALLQAAQRSDVVVCTGGLGPTSDDFTLEVAAKTFGIELVYDVQTLEHLRAFFEARGRELTVENRRQALIPDGAMALKNRIGTAPGVFFEFKKTFYYFLPGVPSEMQQIFSEAVLPHLLQNKVSDKKIFSTVLQTFGRPESFLQKDLADLFTGQSEIQGVRIGFRPKFPEVMIKLSAWHQNETDAQAQVQKIAALVEERIGKYVYAKDPESSLEKVLVKSLADKSQTIAFAESCTGGHIADRLTDVSGSSTVFLGGLVTYSNRFKHEELQVPITVLNDFGAVSEECARAMVKGLQQKTGADYCAAVTGIAGPNGGTHDKPVGTVYIAWYFGHADTAKNILVKKYHFPFQRQAFKNLVASVVFKKILDEIAKDSTAGT